MSNATPRRSLLAAKRISTLKQLPALKNLYSSNGLIHMWDGEWNVAQGTHDQSATRWADLVGNMELSLYGQTLFGQNYMQTLDNSSGVRGTREIANAQYVEIVYEANEAPQGWYDLSDDLSGKWLWAEPKIDTKRGLSKVYWGKSLELASPIPGGIIMLAVSLDGYVCDANGIQGTVVDDYGEDGMGVFSLFGDVMYASEGGCCKGKCYSLRVYSTIPTAEERAKNRAVDIARFGQAGAGGTP